MSRSHKSIYTLFLLFSQVLEHIQRNFWAFLDSPGDENFKTQKNWGSYSTKCETNKMWDKQTDLHLLFWWQILIHFKRRLPTSGSIISAIFASIFKILVPICKHITSIFWNTPLLSKYLCSWGKLWHFWQNQLEKLEAAKAAWLVFLSLLSLTGSYWVLLGLT